MESIRADSQNNRLIVTVSGRPTADGLTELARRTAAEVAKLQRGYVVAIDVRDMAVVDQETTAGIAACQKVWLGGGPSKVGTLVGSAVLMLQLTRQGKHSDSDDITERFSDEAAWHAYLGF
jgi:hypothetical protein